MPVDDFINNTRSESIMNYCPIIFDKERDSYVIDPSKIDDITEDQSRSDDYYKEVENGNTYINKLLDKEEEYFVNKYGEKIYEYLKKIREKYIEKKINRSDVYEDGDEYSEYSGNSENHLTHIKEFYKKEKNGLNSVYELYKNTLFGNIDTDLNRREIYYRTKELGNITYINAISNIIYYFIVICVLIGLFTRNSLGLNNRYRILLYIFIFVFPFVYKHFYNIIVFIIKKIYNLLVNNIPKYSFKNNLKFHKENYYTEDYF